ncbi:unnamed protein product [Linum trigynum]|uniref:Uncharacterized protein n=1 Tax=Linum trigynum TaxID=586398 RepID=A0AAV2DAM2_9ROSI
MVTKDSTSGVECGNTSYLGPFLWDSITVYYVDGLEWVVSTVGVPLHMDRSTRVGAQLGTARACLEMEASSGFPSTVMLYPDEESGFEVRVEYNRPPLVCSKCEMLGHNCNSNRYEGKVWVRKEQARMKTAEKSRSGAENEEVQGIKDKGNAIQDADIDTGSSSLAGSILGNVAQCDVGQDQGA